MVRKQAHKSRVEDVRCSSGLCAKSALWLLTRSLPKHSFAATIVQTVQWNDLIGCFEKAKGANHIEVHKMTT